MAEQFLANRVIDRINGPISGGLDGLTEGRYYVQNTAGWETIGSPGPVSHGILEIIIQGSLGAAYWWPRNAGYDPWVAVRANGVFLEWGVAAPVPADEVFVSRRMTVADAQAAVLASGLYGVRDDNVCAALNLPSGTVGSVLHWQDGSAYATQTLFTRNPANEIRMRRRLSSGWAEWGTKAT